MSDPKKLTAPLRAMLEPIECHSGELLELAVTASGGREYGKLQRLLSAGYVVRVDQPTVKASKWPAEALAVTGLGKMRWRYRKGVDQDRYAGSTVAIDPGRLAPPIFVDDICQRETPDRPRT